MLPDNMYSATANNRLEVVDQVYTTYTLRWPHYKVSASLGTSPCSVRAKTIMVDISSGYIIIYR